ncbi:LCP family protein, partial [Candidatus Saccharibacteria bacterium]|nr:LCP family protein [Candidatus Saccharibacteria bacterium]
MPETKYTEKPTKNRTKSILPIFSYVFFSIYTIFAIILSVILIKVPILPLKYFLPIIILLTILDILFIFFLFRKSTKIVTSLVCIVFEIIFTALIGFALFYLGTTISFFNSIKPQTSIDLPEKTDFDITKDPFNLYISGIDTYGEITTVSRSDVNIVVTVNPRTHTVLLTTVPRDYEVQLHGTTGLKDKLTHAGLYGVEMSIKTIEDLLNIDISYYLRINFDSTIKLIDALGGVEITPDATFYKSKYNCYFRAGVTMHLDGGCALTYARERKTYEFGDLHRIDNQQDI